MTVRQNMWFDSRCLASASGTCAGWSRRLILRHEFGGGGPAIVRSPAWQNPLLCQPLISPNSSRNRVSVLLAPVGGGDLGRLGRLGEKSAFDKHGRHGGFSQDSKASTLHAAIKRGKPTTEGPERGKPHLFVGCRRYLAGETRPV